MGNEESLPCRYYSHPSKSPGICLFLKWIVKKLYGFGEPNSHKFPRVRPTPQCDLEVSFVKTHDTLCLYVENKFEISDMRLDATTTICDEEDGKLLHREAVRECWLKKKPNILPALKNRNRITDSIVIETKLELYRSNGEIWDVIAWERGKEVKLAEDMRNSILAELPAEVVLKTKGDGDEIPANRAVLRARSSVFKKMFDHPLSEQDKGVVPIEDVSGAAMRSLVRFLLSGKADLHDETRLESLEDLYYAADKYQVADLREACAQTMIPLLTKENALRVLVMAYRHSDENLKKECLIFISSSSWIDDIMETEDWIGLKASTPALAFEVLETCVRGGNNDKRGGDSEIYPPSKLRNLQQ